MVLNLEKIDLGGFGIAEEQEDSGLSFTMSEAVKVNPDKQAHINKLSQESGVPPFAVESDPIAVESKLNFDKIDLTGMSKRSPNTAEYLVDFNNAAIAHDDIKILESIESIFDLNKTFENIGASIGAGFKSQAAGFTTIGLERAPTKIEDIVPMSALPIGMKQEALDISQQFASNLGINTDEQLQQAKEGAVEKMLTTLREQKNVREKLQPEDLNLLEQGVRAGVESLANMAPGFGLMLLSGGAAAPLLTTMGVQTFGASYANARADGLDPQKSGWYATIDAAIEVGTEILPVGQLENIITGRTKGISKKALKFMVKEMGTEQLATLGQTINSYLFGLDDELEKAFSEKDLTKVAQIQVQRQAVTAIATVVAGGAQATVATGVNKTLNAMNTEEEKKNKDTAVEQQTIDRLNDNSEKSKLKARDKESFKQFVQKADGENNTHIFLDASQVSLYLQQKTREEISSDTALTLLDDQVREAATLGGEVQIPVADFASEMTGTEHFAQLRDSMTMSENTVSPFRQEQYQQETERYVQSLMTEAQGNVTEYSEAQDIYTTVREQLIDSGRVNAANSTIMSQVVPAWAVAQAKSSGRTVQQVYQDSGLIIEGPLTGEQERLAAEREQFTQGVFAESEIERPVITKTLPKGKIGADAFQELKKIDSKAKVESRNEDGSIQVSYREEHKPTQVKSDNPFLFDFDPGTLVKTETGFKDTGSYVGDALNPITVTKRGGDFLILDGHHRAKIAEENGNLVRAIVIPDKDVKRMELEGVHQADMFTEWVAAGGSDPNILRQEQLPSGDLFVAHNISPKGILEAHDLGGLAAPSIAVGRTKAGFENFGDVTLLADPALLKDPKARTFDADIYSPRQPRATYNVDSAAYSNLYEELDPDNIGLSKPDMGTLESKDGASALLRSDAVMLHWLRLQGKAPKIKKLKVEPEIRTASKIEGPRYQLIDNPKLIKQAEKHYKKLLASVQEKDPTRGERYESFWFEEDGSLKPSSIKEFVNQVIGFRESGGIDVSKFTSDIRDKFRVKKNKAEFEQWVSDQFNSMVKGKTLFKGFTPAGNRKYIEYNLLNVVKEMTQQLKAGESFFYGAGTVRSAYAKELKTIKQIQDKRDKIISDEDFNKVRDESQDVLQTALDKLKPFYKFDSDSWGYANDAGSALAEGKKGQREAFNITPESQKIIDDLIEYLIALPTTYFESKIQRAVTFDEFDTAVVPKGLSQDALQILKDAGLKIKRYDPDKEGDRTEVIAKQKKLLFQPTSEEIPDARGYYDPSNSIIRLTEASDLSTFLHEFAHFMYEMELAGDTEMLQSINNWYKRNAEDVAAEANGYRVEAEIQGKITPEDVNTFLDNKTTGDQDKDDAIRRAVHEQFARGFETYLMEGKAPSIELRNAFRTFARWLAQVYQALRGELDVNLDAEMRQVFDRLLATEEQIAAAEARARFEPMFTTAAMAGMTEEEFAKYQKQQSKVKDVQSETLRDKMIKQLTRQTKTWWKEEKQDIIIEETEKLKTERVYLTADQLRTGEIKLDFATVKEMVGEEKTDKLGRKTIRVSTALKGMTAKEDQGFHPDEVAALFDYNSGSEMLNDLINAPKIADVADTRAEAIMVERHGDIMTDGTIERAADDAVQNEERGKLILQELKALAKGTTVPVIDRQTIKNIATERIGRLAFREIFPGKYRKAEIRAAQEAAIMLKDGNKDGAAAAKMRQVMNYYLGVEASTAKADTMKIVDRMARYNKKKVREEIQKAEGGYWDQIVKILNRFELRKSATLKSVQDVNTWLRERVEVDGDGLILSNEILDESYVTHWKNVPFQSLQGINDSVKNIEHVARYANKITRGQEEVDFRKLVQTWTNSMNDKVKTRFKSTRADVVEGRNWGRWAMAQMTKIPFLASWLDGGERVGLSHDILVQPFTDAYDTEVRLWDAIAKPVMNSIVDRSKADIKRHNRKIYIPEIKDNLYGNQIVAVALNTGNASNLKKLLLGEGWANPEIESEISFDNAKLQAVLSHMTMNDWQLVQKIWDQMNLLYPQLAEVHRKTTGLVPPKVEPTPVVIGNTTFKGGYYPVKYDPNRSQQAELNEDKLNAQTESMFSNTMSIQSSVAASATNERTGYYAPIRLSLDVVPNHFQETIHYITHHDAVRETNRLLRNEQVSSTIKEKLGPEEFAQLKPWLNSIAKDGREAPVKMFWDSMLNRLRFGLTLGVMGFKASTGIIQISGLSNTIAEVGNGPVLQAMRSILGTPADIKSAWDFAVENSKVLSHRAKTMDREIKNAMRQLENKRGIMAAVQETSMKHIALIQTYMVDLPSWHAGYIKELERSGDEQKAYQYADWLIENVQGSGATKDLAAIMRNQSESGRMFTMFMTFFSSLWNMERDLVKGAKSGLYSKTSVAAKAMFLFTVPVIFEMIMRGELGGDDEPEEKLQDILTGVAMFPIQSVPFIRDIASGVTGKFGYNISPIASLIEAGTRTIPKLITNGFTDDEITKSQVKGATKFIGATYGVPGVNQAWATGEHLYQVIEEGEDLTIHQLLFGPERNKP
jgi:hypothetical protein